MQNALKNTSKGFVRVSGRREGRELELWVEDSGCGVAVGPELFSPLARGRGLGLAVCRETAELHGGRLWAESDASGSRFAVTLPCLEERPQGETRRPLVLQVGDRLRDSLSGYDLVQLSEWLESKVALDLVVFDLQVSEEVSRQERREGTGLIERYGLDTLKFKWNLLNIDMR